MERWEQDAIIQADLWLDAASGAELLAEMDEQAETQDYRLDDDYDTDECSEETDYRFGLHV